ncbi:MAG TPA: PIG-L deacetylase family protein, partial [Chloroflexota bacterium]|nr:PIG-L deacetylase family protein [Chloroflexota bacterium]
MPAQPDDRAGQPPRAAAPVEQPADTAQREGADIAGVGAAAAATTPPARGPVLIVAAHPDDPEFGLGATQAKFTAEGREVIVALITSGNEGGEDPTVSDEDLMAQREDEQRRASAVLGVKTVEFLRRPDGLVVNTPELRCEIVRLIRRYKPETVFTHDPANFFSEGHINHPDHRAVGHTTLDAIFPAAGNPRSFRELLAEGLEPHKIKEAYLFFTANANVWIDVTGHLEQKAAALTEHKSQIKQPENLLKRITEGAERAGEPHGVGA